MKRTFLKVSLLSLLAVSMPISFVGCKDYDDDITSINETNDGFSKQLTALQTALDGYKDQAANAQKAADAAAAAAQAADKKGEDAAVAAAAANALAEQAKAAAAQAKADAVADVLSQLKPLIEANKGNIEKNAAQIAALLLRVEGIEKGMADKAAVEAVSKALESYKGDVNGQIGGINSAIDGLKNTVGQLNSAIASINSKLSGVDKIPGLESSISTINTTIGELRTDINDLKNLKSQINGENGVISRISALEAFKTQVVTVETYNEAIEGLKKQIGSINSNISLINQKLDSYQKLIVQNMNDISKLTQRITSLESGKVDKTTLTQEINKISGEISAIDTKVSGILGEDGAIATAVAGNLNTIAGVISGRLTSITLMPTLYIDGIPTIEFLSAKYPELRLVNGEWKPVAPAKDIIVTNGATEVQYRLNPATVNEKGIDLNNLSFVGLEAVSRSEKSDYINVVSSSIESGVLKLNLGKADTKTLNGTNGKIKTVALKVPVTSLFDNEANVYVYSEYNRLNETYFKPTLGRVPAAGNVITDHFMDSVAAYNKATFDDNCIPLVYNQKHDLFDIAEVCALFGTGDNATHKAMVRDDYQKYGFDIYFHVAAADFNATDGTNQQKFAKIEGGMLTPVVPRGQGNNESIIGRHPIIRATLYDTVNKKVVDQRYFKVLFTAQDMQPINRPLSDAEVEMGCNEMTAEISWLEFQQEVLEFISNNGMSKSDFVTIYGTNPVITCTGGTVTATINDTQDSNSAVFDWKISNAQVGSIVPGGQKTYSATITFHNAADLYPDVVLTWNLKVNVPTVKFALGATDNVKWKNGNMLVYPVPMPSNYAIGGTKAEYNTNILEGRMTPYVTNLWDCTLWDVDLVAGTTGCTLTLPAGKAHYALKAADAAGADAIKNISFVIPNDAAGIALVNNGVGENNKVTLTWNAYFNGISSNKVNIGTTTLEIVKPLKLIPTAEEGLVDNSREVSVPLNARIEDAYGNVVSNAATATELAQKYYDYYGVEAVVWGKHYQSNGSTVEKEIKIADNAAGTLNLRSLASLNMTADVEPATGTLKFQNNGSPIQSTAYLMVPVSVKHKWGIINGTVAVTLSPKL